MFQTLDDDLKREDGTSVLLQERCKRYAVVAGLAIVICGGLFAAVRFLS